MIEAFTGEHGGFILAAYIATVVIIGALAAWVLIDRAQVNRKFAALEAAGLRRRSDRASSRSDST